MDSFHVSLTARMITEPLSYSVSWLYGLYLVIDVFIYPTH